MSVQPRVAFQNLPEEVVEEIIKHSLEVSDEDFKSSVEGTIFGRFSEPSSSILLVCKKWFRIAVPHFYEFIVLRTSGQTESLLRILRGPKGKEIAQRVRRLRVEDYLGDCMGKVLTMLSRNTEIFIANPYHEEDVWDAYVALSRGPISDFAPKRITYRSNLVENDRTSCLLVNSLVGWESLESFELLISDSDIGYSRGALYDSFRKLSKSKNLSEIVIKGNLEETEIEEIAQIIEHSVSPRSLDIFTNRVQDLYSPTHKFVTIHHTPPEQDINSNYSTANKLDYTGIWLKIIIYQLSDYRGVQAKIKRINELRLVSSAFNRSCCALQKVQIKNVYDMEPFISSNIICKLISTVAITSSQREGSFEDKGSTLEVALKSFRNTKRLVVTSDYTAYFYRDSIRPVITGLRHLVINYTEVDFLCLTAISQLPVLEDLELNRDLEDVYDDEIFFTVNYKSVVIANIRRFIIQERLSQRCLSCLMSCTFPAVQEIILNVCVPSIYGIRNEWEDEKNFLSCFPNLETFHAFVTDEYPFIPYLSGGNPNLTLVTIESMFCSMFDFTPYSRRKSEMRQQNVQLKSLDSAFYKFRKLKEVQFKDAIEWPWRDRDLDNWSFFVETWMENLGITVSNREGVPFRARLKTLQRREEDKMRAKMLENARMCCDDVGEVLLVFESLCTSIS